MGLPLPGPSNPLGALGLGVLPQSGGAGATITGYNQATGVLSGISSPGLLVVMSIAGVYISSTLADATGKWSITTSGIGGQSVAVSAVPVGTIIAPGGPGSQLFTTGGSINFPVPNYRTLIVDVWGSGSSGSTGNNSANAGGQSYISVLNLSASGGPGFGAGSSTTGIPANTASGGDTNLSGNNINTTAGAGASGTGGGAGGAASGVNGSAPGGAGAGGSGGYGGISGAYCRKTYTFGVTAGFPSPGSALSGVVGNGGASAIASGGFSASGAGGNGGIKFTWS